MENFLEKAKMTALSMAIGLIMVIVPLPIKYAFAEAYLDVIGYMLIISPIIFWSVVIGKGLKRS